jgi:hypothetical protein
VMDAATGDGTTGSPRPILHQGLPTPTTMATLSNNLTEQQTKRNDNDNKYHTNNPSSTVMSTLYGAPIMVTTTSNFPAIGSTLGPYFSIGKLGKGTFCSIHKCINLHYFHHRHNYDKNKNHNNKTTKEKIPRLAAAKVEIGEFINSGILGGEASILHFLHSVLPDHTVPMYLGLYQASSSGVLDLDGGDTTCTNNNTQNSMGHNNDENNNKRLASFSSSNNNDNTKPPTDTNNDVTTSAIVMEYLVRNHFDFCVCACVFGSFFG